MTKEEFEHFLKPFRDEIRIIFQDDAEHTFENIKLRYVMFDNEDVVLISKEKK